MEFIRQQWRMWIETNLVGDAGFEPANSFASNGECGLKQTDPQVHQRHGQNSFASNGECGLKQEVGHQRGAARY